MYILYSEFILFYFVLLYLFIYLFILFFFKIRWLLIKGFKYEAECVLRKMFEANGQPLPHLELSSIHSDDYNTRDSQPASYSDLIYNREIFRLSLPLWCVWFLFGFTYNGILIFSIKLFSFNSYGNSKNTNTCVFDYSSIFLNSIAEFSGVTVSALCIDKLGRQRTQSFFYMLAGVSVFVLGISFELLQNHSDKDLTYHPLFLFLSMISRMSIMTASNSTWVITPELYPTKFRTIGHAVCIAMSKVGAFLCPYLVISNMSVFTVSGVLAVMNILAAISVIYLKETSGRQFLLIIGLFIMYFYYNACLILIKDLLQSRLHMKRQHQRILISRSLVIIKDLRLYHERDWSQAKTRIAILTLFLQSDLNTLCDQYLIIGSKST